MIVLDLETSGLYPEKCGIWQVGAVEFEKPENIFLEECRIDDDDEIQKEALIICGKTEEELKDKNKQSQKEMIEKLFKWIEKIKVKNLVCQNPQFDFAFLTMKARKYNIKIPFHYRTIDLHSVAQTIYYIKNKSFSIDEDKCGMGLSKILEMCGEKDERMALKNGEIVREGKPHNALEDAQLEAKCLRKLLE